MILCGVSGFWPQARWSRCAKNLRLISKECRRILVGRGSDWPPDSIAVYGSLQKRKREKAAGELGNANYCDRGVGFSRARPGRLGQVWRGLDHPHTCSLTV